MVSLWRDALGIIYDDFAFYWHLLIETASVVDGQNMQ
jgi:hypothetical protein